MGDLTEHFRWDELCCSCVNCDRTLGWTSEGLDRLEEFRIRFGRPIIPSSSYRCFKHPIEQPKDHGPGPHNIVDGGNITFDTLIDGEDAYHMVKIAMEMAVPGVGIKQHSGGRMIHLDWAPSRPEAPRPRVWTYRD